MAQGKITSLDVARRAGVSQSAVSRVFTPGASASPATAAKVKKAAMELGYRPNPIARAMITGKSRIVGLLVAYLDNQFYPLALERLSQALQERGYHILVFMAQNSEDEISNTVQELLGYRVDGIIAASVSVDSALTAQCAEAGIPVVLFNRGQDGRAMFLAPREDRDGRADARELHGDRLAEAGAAAGHDHDLAVVRAEGQRVRADCGGSGEAHVVVLLCDADAHADTDVAASGRGSGRAMIASRSDARGA